MKKTLYLFIFIFILLMSSAFAKTEISEITINGLPEIVGGNSITSDFTINEEGISVELVSWDKKSDWGNYDIGNPEVFDSGESYRVYISYDISDDFELAEEYTINTPNVTPTEIYSYEDYCYLYFVVPGEKSKNIKSVEITGVPEPVAGKSKSINGIFANSPYYSIDTNNTYWLVGGETKYFNDEIFATETIYGIYVLVEPVDDYYFDDEITATVNGNVASDIQKRGVNDKNRAIIYHFPATSSTPVIQLDSITIDGIPELTVGNTITFDGYSIAEDGVSVDYVSWDKADEYNTYNITVNEGDKFEEGLYRIFIKYSIADGYAIKDTYNLTSNQIGTDYSPYEDYCYIDFEISSSKHKVTFNPNNGSPAWIEYVEDGQTVYQPDDPTYSYLIFEGWKNGNISWPMFDFSTPITEDIILSASWVFKWTLIATPQEGGKCARTDSEENEYQTTYTQTGAYYGNPNYYNSFSAVANKGYHFKEWRIGSSDGEAILTTDNNELCYIDSNNNLYIVESADFSSPNFYAIFEKNNVGEKGDVDGNGIKDIIDVRMILQAYIHSTSETKWTEDEIATMDIDNNNTIDLVDVRLLLQEYIS